MSSCNNNKALFVDSNKHSHVTIGAHFERTINVDVTDNGVTSARNYNSITLSGCIDAKDADNNDLNISLAEVADEVTTGIYKVDANHWKFIVSESTSLSVVSGIYNFVIYGVPADNKKYVELHGKIEFKEVAEC